MPCLYRDNQKQGIIMLRNTYTNLIFIFAISIMITFPGLNASAQETGQEQTRSFSEFHNDTIHLSCQATHQSLHFNLPAEWQLVDEITFQLRLTILPPATNNIEVQSTIAALKLIYNGQLAGSIPINQYGDVMREMIISLSSLNLTPHGIWQFELESYLPCSPNESGIDIRIHPDSQIRFFYEVITPIADFSNFPRQLIQETFEADRAVLVIPDEPTIIELQSALTVAAGLGRISDNKIALQLIRASQIDTEIQANHHLILIGKPEPFLPFKELIFPSPIIFRSDPEWTVQFLLPDRYEFERTVPDDGLVQMINSPWNSSRFILLVSGETDAGVLKAAQALSSGRLRTNVYPNLAIVKETRIDEVPASSFEISSDFARVADVSSYFTSHPTLGSTAFVLPRDNLSAWEMAIQIAEKLGSEVDGNAINLSVYYGDEFSKAMLSNFHALFVGQAGDFPVIAELGDELPVVFEKQKNVPEDMGFDIVYRMSKDFDSAGYLMSSASKHRNHVILAVLGDDETGIQWAAHVLLNMERFPQITEDFALINGDQVYVKENVKQMVPEPSPTTESENPDTIKIVKPMETPNSLLGWQIATAVLFVANLLLLVRLKK
jgi:hypothetical protein